MTGTWRWRIVLATVVGAALTRSAGAGVEVMTQFQELDSGAAQGKATKAPREGRTFVEGDDLRMEMGTAGAMIFRGEKDLMWILQPKDHAYVELTRESTKQLAKQAESAMAEMRAQLDKMPPAQRAQIEKMMNQSGMGGATAAPKAAPEPLTVKPTGRSDSVEGRTCREVEVFRGAAKESEACVADWATAGVTKEDFGAFQKLASWQNDILGGTPWAKSAANPSADAMKLFDQLGGVPVRVRSFRGGKPANEMLITKIEKKHLDPALFDVPADYTKKTSPSKR